MRTLAEQRVYADGQGTHPFEFHRAHQGLRLYCGCKGDVKPVTFRQLLQVPRGRVKLTCWACDPVRRAYFAHAEIAAIYGQDLTFEALRGRVKCAACGTLYDGDRVTFELDQGPPPLEEALRDIWGGVNGQPQLEQLLAEKAKRGRR